MPEAPVRRLLTSARQFSFNGVTIRGYMGVFADANVYCFSQEFGYEMAFGEGGSARASSQFLRLIPLSQRPIDGWRTHRAIPFEMGGDEPLGCQQYPAAYVCSATGRI